MFLKNGSSQLTFLYSVETDTTLTWTALVCVLELLFPEDIADLVGSNLKHADYVGHHS